MSAGSGAESAKADFVLLQPGFLTRVRSGPHCYPSPITIVDA
jgi:hypothetical protein